MRNQEDEPTSTTVRKRPCSSCPYRRDVPSGIWQEHEYAKLPRYDGDVPDQVMARATGLFYCHQQDRHLCAGWVGCHDMDNNLAVRLSHSDIDPAVYEYVSPVPLFASGAEAAEHGRCDLDAPSPEATRKMAQLRGMQSRRAGQ
jgi:hypothetical protein